VQRIAIPAARQSVIRPIEIGQTVVTKTAASGITSGAANPADGAPSLAVQYQSHKFIPPHGRYSILGASTPMSARSLYLRAKGNSHRQPFAHFCAGDGGPRSSQRSHARTRARRSIALTAEMLLTQPSGNLFGLTQTPAWAGTRRICSTPSPDPEYARRPARRQWRTIALGFHTGH